MKVLVKFHSYTSMTAYIIPEHISSDRMETITTATIFLFLLLPLLIAIYPYYRLRSENLIGAGILWGLFGSQCDHGVFLRRLFSREQTAEDSNDNADGNQDD